MIIWLWIFTHNPSPIPFISMLFQNKYKPVALSAEQAFLFYAEPDNLKSLMPEQITDWESGEDWCRFLIKGMGHVKLKIGEKSPYSKLTYLPDGKMPFDFGLQFLFVSKNENACEIQIAIDADLSNPMMAMLAKKPLQNLVNEMVKRL